MSLTCEHVAHQHDIEEREAGLNGICVRHLYTRSIGCYAGLYLSDFHWGRGGSEFRLAMTDRAI